MATRSTGRWDGSQSDTNANEESQEGPTEDNSF